jgi:hypothetical protein
VKLLWRGIPVQIGDDMEDFIRVYDNAVSREFCKGIIEYFEWCIENNKVWSRSEAGHVKKDLSTALNPQNFWEIDFAFEHLSGYINEFNDVFWNQAYKSYCEEFSTLNDVQKHSIFTYKVQKTQPGGGYHVWHCEQDSTERSRRIGTYILYLNDIVEGGETEFLYQSSRVSAKEGRLCIFPSSYTHTHRGNPPLKGNKYIMTGWIEFC